MKKKILITGLIIVALIILISAVLLFRKPSSGTLANNINNNVQLSGNIAQNVQAPDPNTPGIQPVQSTTGNTVTPQSSNKPGQQQVPTKPAIKTVPADLLSYSSLTKAEVISKFGKTFRIYETGPNKEYYGYYYENAGMIFTFDDFEEEDPNAHVAFIDCAVSVNINGATSGMNFTQVQALLGNATVSEVSKPHSYKIEYVINNSHVKFVSKSEDGKDSIMTIFK